MIFPTFEEWLPGWLARQEARRKRRKQMIAAIRLRKLMARSVRLQHRARAHQTADAGFLAIVQLRKID